ncbi:MAG: hypothetical protein ACRDNS_12450, partial [Trebonia sp.]
LERRREPTVPVRRVMTQLDIGRFGRVLNVFAAALAAAILVAACGGSHPTHTRKSADGSRSIRFARCMRANGVPGFPDSGAEVQFSQSGKTVSIDGVSVSSPAFQSAQQKCEHYISSGAPSAAQQAKFKQEILKVARCMRAHGVSDYPDSGTWTGPNPNPQSPAFKAAAKKCGTGGVATSMSLP